MGMPVCQFHHQISTPRLSEDNGLLSGWSWWVNGIDGIGNVVNNRGHLVALFGFVAQAMATKVNCCDCMPHVGQIAGGAVPEPSV
jgi:hypothetical protein